MHLNYGTQLSSVHQDCKIFALLTFKKKFNYYSDNKTRLSAVHQGVQSVENSGQEQVRLSLLFRVEYGSVFDLCSQNGQKVGWIAATILLIFRVVDPG